MKDHSESAYEDEQTPRKYDNHLDRSLPADLKKIILELSFGEKEDHDSSPTNSSGGTFGRSPSSAIITPQHYIDVESTAAIGDYNEIDNRGHFFLEGRNKLCKDSMEHHQESIVSNTNHIPENTNTEPSNNVLIGNPKATDDSVWKKIRNHMKKGFKYSNMLIRRNNKGKFSSSDGLVADSIIVAKKHKRHGSASSTRALTGIECLCSLSPITFEGKNADLIEELEQRQEVENNGLNREQMAKEVLDSLTRGREVAAFARRRSETYAENKLQYIRRGSKHYTHQSQF